MLYHSPINCADRISDINANAEELTDPLADQILAAIDIGSNSFHLIVARMEHQELRPIETLSEKVQLGSWNSWDL